MMRKKIPSASPLLIVLILSILFLIYGNKITASELMRHLPNNTFLVIVFIMALFALKSLVVVFPLPVLYIFTGLIFDPVTAIAVNILGAMVCTTVPYIIGRLSGAKIVDGLIEKFPVIKSLEEFKNDNELFFPL